MGSGPPTAMVALKGRSAPSPVAIARTGDAQTRVGDGLESLESDRSAALLTGAVGAGVEALEGVPNVGDRIVARTAEVSAIARSSVLSTSIWPVSSHVWAANDRKTVTGSMW